jgi:hypothetical protein
MAQTNTVLTQIAVKRLSGKAQTNANNSLGQEPKGSTVQTTATTVFAEALPNNPAQTLYLIQSESVGSPGTAMFAEFEIRAFGDQYANDGEDGETTINTFHSYELILSTSFDNGISSGDFNTHASTPTSFGTFPFNGGSSMTGSRGRLQIIPEFVSDIPAGVGASNPYIPQLFSTLNPDSSPISATDGIDWYLDAFSGILFIQDPVAYGSIGSPNTNAAVPFKIKAFAYVGKYQDQATFTANDVGLHISASTGTGFSLANDATASFESGSAGITVTADASKKITIGASTDNVQFANLTGSNLLITNTASITYFETTYESSSIIFSSGSTKFGDTNDDTHVFTGSVAILYTGSSVGPEYGLQMSGSNFLIDYGNSGSVTLGTHNVGFEINSILPITGSGLIISQSFTNEATTHNMVKIGETELIDVSGSQFDTDSFLINIRKKALVISSSELNKPAARVEAGNTAFYGSTSDKEVIKINSDIVTIGTNTANTIVDATNLSLLPVTSLNMGVGNGQQDDLSYSANKNILVAQSGDIDNGTTGTAVKSAPLSNIYPLFKGAVTASHVSSSGNLFASLSLESTAGADVLAVVYDTGSGKFFYTGSYGAGGNTTQLETSASVGIHLSASQGTGFSIGLMQSASFTSGSGGGLTVTAGNTNNIEFELVGVLSSSQQIATDISGAINSATSSLSASIVGTANEVEVTSTEPGNVTIGLPDDVTIAGNLNVNGSTLATDDTTFNLLDTTATTINFGGAATTIDIGAAGNSNVNIKGSASIDGDLIVKGTTTSINTDQLLVEDPFILLASSSSDPNTDGGIIIQTNASAQGTALFYDNSSNRWALAESSSVAHDVGNNTAVAHQYVVSVSSSTANPTGAPSNFGLSGNSLLGMMYVATTDNDNDTNTIWIYG